MNNIWMIAFKELALFSVVAFLEVVEFVIERQEIYYSGISAERTEVLGILLEIRSQMRTCFFVERSFLLLHTRVSNVECAIYA